MTQRNHNKLKFIIQTLNTHKAKLKVTPFNAQQGAFIRESLITSFECTNCLKQTCWLTALRRISCRQHTGTPNPDALTSRLRYDCCTKPLGSPGCIQQYCTDGRKTYVIPIAFLISSTHNVPLPPIRHVSKIVLVPLNDDRYFEYDLLDSCVHVKLAR
jgi:hypothetical protein